MRQWNKAEIVGALGFVIVGVVALVIARQYPMGTIVRMGPGFVPVSLAILLIIVGIVIAVQGRSLPKAEFEFKLKPFVFILGGILAWALLVDRLGFLIATAVLVPLCATVERQTTGMSAIAVTLALILVGYVVFIQGIGIPISLFGE